MRKINFICFNGRQPSKKKKKNGKKGNRRGGGEGENEKKGRNKIECVGQQAKPVHLSQAFYGISTFCATFLQSTLLGFCRWMHWSANSASLSAEPSPFLLLSITVLLPRVGGKAPSHTWMHKHTHAEIDAQQHTLVDKDADKHTAQNTARIRPTPIRLQLNKKKSVFPCHQICKVCPCEFSSTSCLRMCASSNRCVPGII